MLRVSALVGLLALWTANFVLTDKSLTNQDIEKLVVAQLEPSLIIRVIEANPSSFDTSPKALQKLKAKGASQEILDAMAVSKVETKRAARVSANTASLAMNAGASSFPASFPPFEEVSCSFTELSECPAQGCAHDEEHALFNEVKRHTPNGSTMRLDFHDFAVLQADVEKVGIETGGEISVEDRNHLKGLKLPSNRTAGEQDLVQIVGYIVGKPHPNKGESVNCGLHGSANNDIHISLIDDPEKSEYEGIVVEMIPQDREKRKGWNVAGLNKVRVQKRQVLVEGQLFLDNEHVVNEDEEHPIGGQPARMSLWEVHPVTALWVCSTPGTCDPNVKSQWIDLGTFVSQ